MLDAGSRAITNQAVLSHILGSVRMYHVCRYVCTMCVGTYVPCV